MRNLKQKTKKSRNFLKLKSLLLMPKYKQLFYLFLILLIPVILTTFVFASLFPAKAQVSRLETESILSYHTDMVINTNGSVDVTETIVHNNPDPHHGLYRDIPFKYVTNKGTTLKTDINVKEVYYYKLGEQTQYNPYTQSTYDGRYKRLKIGDPDVYISGPYVYVIKYQIKDVINFFEDHDELYWNVVGTEWVIPIEEATVKVTVPANISDYTCYSGLLGSKNQNCSLEIDPSAANIITGQTKTTLDAGFGFTIVISMPANTIAKPTLMQKILKLILTNGGFFLVIPSLILIYIIWAIYGKDPKPKTVVPSYEPPKDISPLLGGYLYQQKTDLKHLTAHIIYLAVNGYLIIEKENSSYKLIRTKKTLEKASNIDVVLLNGLFEKGDQVSLKDLKNKFYKTVDKVKKATSSRTKELAWMNQTSGCLTGVFIALGILLFSGSFITFGFTVPYGYISYSIWLLIAGVALFGFGFFMPKRTKEGNQRYTDLLGLKMYIKTAEKKRIEFHNNPKKAITIFETLLPYAMIFGLEKLWAKEFEDLYTEPPDWYRGYRMHQFNSVVFAQNVGKSFSKSMVSVSSPPAASGSSGFGGGGFSGGGGGGGGGGSW